MRGRCSARAPVCSVASRRHVRRRRRPSTHDRRFHPPRRDLPPGPRSPSLALRTDRVPRRGCGRRGDVYRPPRQRRRPAGAGQLRSPSGSTSRSVDAGAVHAPPTRRDQSASCSFNVTVSAIPRLTRTRFLAFGDSFTAGEVTIPTAADAPGGPELPAVGRRAASYPTLLTNAADALYRPGLGD